MAYGLHSDHTGSTPCQLLDAVTAEALSPVEWSSSRCISCLPDHTDTKRQSRSASTAQQGTSPTCSTPAASYTHHVVLHLYLCPAVTSKDISDEWYLRQRSQITLGELLPHVTVSAWVSPSAVVIGDVDLLDRVSTATQQSSSNSSNHRSHKQYTGYIRISDAFSSILSVTTLNKLECMTAQPM